LSNPFYISTMLQNAAEQYVPGPRNADALPLAGPSFIFDDFTQHHSLSSFRKTAVIHIFQGFYYNLSVSGGFKKFHSARFLGKGT